MSDLPPRRDLGDLMNCTICLDEPASPINSCDNGHIICGICVDKVKECGICQSPNMHVNHFAERLSRQFDFKLACRNQHSGCTEVIAAAGMKPHLEKCYFRDIICAEWTNGFCGKTKVPMTEYAKHLQVKHNSPTSSPNNLSLALENEKAFDYVGLSFPTAIFEHDGHTFLLLGRICRDAVYFWMTVLGSKETAEKYVFEFKVYKTREGGKELNTLWTLPVLAFHDRPNYVEGGSSYVRICPAMAIDFGIEQQGDKFKLLVPTSYRLL